MNKRTSLRSIIIILIILLGVLAPLAATVFTPTTFAQYQPTYSPTYPYSTYYSTYSPPPYCDKEIMKTIAPYKVESGYTATVTITIANLGTGACPQVYGQWTMEDNVPSSMIPIQSSLTVTPNDGWSVDCWPGSGTCTDVGLAFNGIMYPGYYVTITFQVEITADSGTLQNCALVAQWDGVSGNANQSCATVTVVPYTPPPECIPEITKTMSPDRVMVGSTPTVRITLTNVGTGTCPITPTKFVGDVFVGMTPIQSSLTIAPKAGWSAVWLPHGEGVEFYFANTMPVGYSVTFTFQVTITAAAENSVIVNCAEVGWKEVPGAVVMGCATVTVTHT